MTPLQNRAYIITENCFIYFFLFIIIQWSIPNQFYDVIVFAFFFKVWKISKNLRNDITKKKYFFSRIHFFFISCPILVGFSLLYLKLAFLTFLFTKKRFFAKMRKFFKISAKIFFSDPPLRGLGGRYGDALCAKTCWTTF